MAATVELAFKLTGLTAIQKGVGNLKTGLNNLGNTKAGRTFKSLDKNFQGLQKTVFNLKNAFVTVAGAAGIGAVVNANLKAIDSLAKTSDKLGLTTEALSGLRHAAELTGVSSNTLDMALQRMTRRVGEAAQGTGEAKDALRELGLDAKKLQEAGPDKAFSMISEAMGDVTNQSDKVRLAFKLFDSEGVALVNTLDLGSEGLAQAALEAEKFGLAISRDAARGVEEANDALTRAKAATKGLGISLTADLAPEIKGAAELFTDWVQIFKQELPLAISKFKQIFISGIATIQKAGIKFDTFWKKAGLAFEAAFRNPFKAIQSLALQMFANIIKIAKKFVGFFDRDMERSLEGFERSLELSAIKTLDLGEAFEKIEREASRSIDKIDKNAEDYVRDEERRQRDLIQTYERQNDERVNSEEIATRKIVEANERANNKIKNSHDDMLKDTQKQREDQQKEIEEHTKKVHDFWKTNVFDELITKGNTFGEAMKNIWKNIKEGILQYLSELLTNQLMNSFFNVTGTGGGGLSFGGGTGISIGGGGGIGGTGISFSGGGISVPGLGNLGGTLGKFFGGAGIGGLAGGLIGKLTGGNETNAAIGGALGAGIGAAIPGFGAGAGLGIAGLLGPAGIALGLVGALAGSFLGGKPSDKTQAAKFNLDAFRIENRGLEGKKFSQQNKDAANAIAQVAVSMAQDLEKVTGKDLEGDIDVIIGSRDGTRIRFPGKTTQNFGVGNFDKALEYISSSLIELAGGEAFVQGMIEQYATSLRGFATGGDAVFTRRTMIQVGEQGAERVSVRPIGGAGVGGGVTVVFQGPNIIDETSLRSFVRKIEEVLAREGTRFA